MIMFLLFDLINALVPTIHFAIKQKPIFDLWNETLTDPKDDQWNLIYKISAYINFVGNLVLYGLAFIIGLFAFTWKPLIVTGYLSWTQYIIAYSGNGLQLLFSAFKWLAAFYYKNDGVPDDSPYALYDNNGWAYGEAAVYTVLSMGIVVAQWIFLGDLDDYFRVKVYLNN